MPIYSICQGTIRGVAFVRGGAPENRAFSDFGYYQFTRYLERILPNYAMSTFRLNQRNDGKGRRGGVLCTHLAIWP